MLEWVRKHKLILNIIYFHIMSYSTFNELNQKAKGSVFFKMVVVGILILILLIPSGMIRNLVHERQNTRDNAVTEVSSKWGDSQLVSGPILMIPFHRNSTDSAGKIQTLKETAYFLPENLQIDGKVEPEIRHRGIYDVLLYKSDLMLRGNFSAPDWKDWNIAPEQILFSEATLLLGIPDLRGIREGINLSWNAQSILMEPGLPSKDVISSGVSAPIVLNDSLNYPFELQMKLNGSRALHFTPVGKETNMHLTSSWPSPSFSGSFLPENYEMTKNGFRANWKVLHLNRNFPQKWQGSSYQFNQLPQGFIGEREFTKPIPYTADYSQTGNSDSRFGVELLIPVDSYQKSDRSAKYMIMFVFLTFLVFFFVEVLHRRRIHPIQYLLVGFALLIFYLLLLSMSEYTGFSLAYLGGSAATILLITLYSLTVFHEKRLSILLGGILVFLYGFLYTLLQLEDYALLMGSIGLFVILAVIMFLTRKVEWYKDGI